MASNHPFVFVHGMMGWGFLCSGLTHVHERPYNEVSKETCISIRMREEYYNGK